MAFIGGKVPKALGRRVAQRAKSSGLDKTKMLILAMERMLDVLDDDGLIAESIAYNQKQAALRAARGSRKAATV